MLAHPKAALCVSRQCKRRQYRSLQVLALVTLFLLEHISASSSDATLKSLTFQRRRRRDTSEEDVSVTLYQTHDRGDYEQLKSGAGTVCYSGNPLKKYLCFTTPGLNALNWNATFLNGSAWVYNPVNYCPTDKYTPNKYYTHGGKEDVGPYLIVHPIPTDPGATVKVRTRICVMND